jgi:site-specific DNA-methyltransferase (adenine-specific)
MTGQRRPRKGSSRDEWETPPDLFAVLHAEFNFDIDVCASAANAKLPCFITKELDGLVRPWHGTFWMNPPYSDPGPWCKKAHEMMLEGMTGVALLPVATDTKYFHAHVLDVADEVRFPDRRLRFVGAESGATQPNVIVVYRPHLGPTRYVRWAAPR